MSDAIKQLQPTHEYSPLRTPSTISILQSTQRAPLILRKRFVIFSYHVEGKAESKPISDAYSSTLLAVPSELIVFHLYLVIFSVLSHDTWRCIFNSKYWRIFFLWNLRIFTKHVRLQGQNGQYVEKYLYLQIP
jgi:hypothetical protein